MSGWILVFFLLAFAAASVGMTALDQMTAAVAGSGCGAFTALGLIGLGFAVIRNR